MSLCNHVLMQLGLIVDDWSLNDRSAGSTPPQRHSASLCIFHNCSSCNPASFSRSVNTVHTYLFHFASYGGHRLHWIRALWCYMLTCLLSNPAKAIMRVTSANGQMWQIFTACIEKCSFMLILCYPNVRPRLCMAEGKSMCCHFDTLYLNQVVKHC